MNKSGVHQTSARCLRPYITPCAPRTFDAVPLIQSHWTHTSRTLPRTAYYTTATYKLNFFVIIRKTINIIVNFYHAVAWYRKV